VNVLASATASALASLFGAVLAGNRVQERELLGRIADGGPEALKSLYERVSSRAMAMAFRLLRDRFEAEDVVQETFVEVWKRAGQYEASRGGADAWVVAIARNRAIDRLRAQGSSARTARRAFAESEGVGPVPAEVPGERRRERVIGALSALPAEQRRVIELAYFDGLTQTEIASHTNEPLGTVKTRVRLAMAKLADLLAEEAEGAA
jgi:RNA polymerase sigma-70 factor (ECF subfamily)